MLGAGAALLFMAVVNKQSYVYDFEGTVLAVQGKGIRALAVTSQVNERTLQEPTAVNLGNKGPYPLSLCEGDCDNNDHCEGDLVCHDRYVVGVENYCLPRCSRLTPFYVQLFL